MLSQIVAEELALPLAWVRLAQPESGTSPYDQATSSSRSTTLVGLALQAAARDLRQQLLELAAEQLQTHIAHLTLRDGGVEAPGGRLSYAEIIAQHIWPAWGGTHWPRRLSWRTRRAPGRCGAVLGGQPGSSQVEVDEGTGQVQLQSYISIADVGKAIHPQQCEAQEEGGVMMGIGHTLFEQMIYQDGQLLNPGLIDYRIPTMEDLPEELAQHPGGERRWAGAIRVEGHWGERLDAHGAGHCQCHCPGYRRAPKALPLTPERVGQP